MDAAMLTLKIVSILVVLFAIAIFERQCLAVIEALFRMILSPIAIAEESLRNLWMIIINFFQKQLAKADGHIDPRQIFYEIIGSVLYCICFLLFGYADFHLICMTLAAMGIEGNFPAPPGGAVMVTGLALCSGVLFFGTMFLDLIGMTQIAPWHERLSQSWRKAMAIICAICLVLSILTAVLFGYWRGKANQDDMVGLPVAYAEMFNGDGLTDFNGAQSMQIQAPNVATQATPDAWVPIVVNITIPLLLVIGGCLSGYGLVQFIKFAVLAIILIFTLPAGILLVILSYLSRVIEHIYNLVVSIINLFGALGRWFFGLFNYHPEVADTENQPGKPNASSRPEPKEDTHEDEPFVNPYESKKEN